MDLYDAASFHQLELNVRGRSPQTQKTYLTYERRFLAYLQAKELPATLEALNSVNVRQALLWMQGSQLGRRHGQRAREMFLDVMKIWASFLATEDVIPANPLDRVKPVSVTKVERIPFTRSDVLAMLEASRASVTPERDRALLLFLLDTGARISEATGITLPDLDMGARRVLVLGKGNHERLIPFGTPTAQDGGTLVRALRAYITWRHLRLDLYGPQRSGEHLWITKWGFPLTAEGAREALGMVGRRAGVREAIPHRFRHTFATIYLTEHPDDRMGLQAIMGHLDADVLDTYVHLAHQTIVERAGRAAPSDHWLKDTRRQA